MEAPPVRKKKLTNEELRRMRERDHQEVRGIFRSFEPPGGSITFSFLKYKGDQVKHYTLVDGNVYTLPRMVAKHLNQQCWYPQHAHTLDASGQPIVHVGKKIQRCSFESLEFQEIEDAETE